MGHVNRMNAKRTFGSIGIFLVLSLALTCGGRGNVQVIGKLGAEPCAKCSPGNPDAFSDSGDGNVKVNSLFDLKLGQSVSAKAIGAVDPTGLSITSDKDGDGIPDVQETTTDPYVADYPRVTTRISAPITMEVRVSQTSSSENHSETMSESDVKDTLSNSMENRQYASLNQKTTPVVTKESEAGGGKTDRSYGFASSSSFSVAAEASVGIAGIGGSGKFSTSVSKSVSGNQQVVDEWSKSTSSEKTTFPNVDFEDNLSRNGTEFTQNTVEKISKNARRSEVLKNSQNIGPNAGVVRAALFIKNESVNMPVHIKNILCTLSFRTPTGQYLPVQTFYLRSEDYSRFEQDIYGGQEFGPYTIEIPGLNTAEVINALKGGYVPQIHVVSYDMTRVTNSNYNPGVDNLKIVEESAKGRTATIKIVSEGQREIYKVAAFDVDAAGNYSPGISLKKALFRIFRSRIGVGETYDSAPLTVPDANLKWRTGAATHGYQPGITGNNWAKFETYLKPSVDAYGNPKNFESIRRIGNQKKYNPYDVADNAAFNENQLMDESEIRKMKYWVILHNGEYFDGDLNDAIWVGERYELIYVDINDFNNHFKGYQYTPLQSAKSLALNTRWNKLTNEGEFARSIYLGQAVRGDVIHLEVDLPETRYLFDKGVLGSQSPFGARQSFAGEGSAWHNFNYTFADADELPQGVPKDFTFSASGGPNQITVFLTEAVQFARSYDVTFTGPGGGRTVNFSAADFETGSGSVFITRKTIDINNAAVGTIAAGGYSVTMRAKGMAYEVPVATNSKTGAIGVTVVNPPAVPSGFNFAITGRENRLDVRIDSAINAEYYLIRVYGPDNYTANQWGSPYYQAVGHTGLNILKVPTPAASSVNLPGVYRVRVYAVNGNTITAGVEDDALMSQSLTGEQYAIITYDEFQAQKAYSPKLSKELQFLKSIDLEVNFNDSTGWYRLLLSSEHMNSPKYLDTQYTSYIDFAQQKFHVFFKAPVGDAFSPYDAFAGGRNEVDIYIRTAAEAKYRDTFWPKPNAAGPLNSAARFLFLDEPVANQPNFSVLDYYIGKTSPSATNFYSEATHIKSTLASNGLGRSLIFDAGGNFLSYPTQDFTLVSNSSSNAESEYFFSPLEYRVYSLKASFTGQPLVLNGQVPTVASFDEPIENLGTVRFNNIGATRGTEFTVYYRAGTKDSLVNNGTHLLEDFTQSPWMSTPGGTIMAGTDTHALVTTGFTPNQKHVFYVQAKNQYGVSPKPALAELREVYVYPSVPPVAPQVGLNAVLGSDNTSIIVNNIFIPGETMYEIQKKRMIDTTWSSVVTLGNSSSLPGQVWTHTIPGLLPWDRYLVRVRGVRPTGAQGAWSSELRVDTPTTRAFTTSCNVFDSSPNKYFRVNFLTSIGTETVNWGYSGSSTSVLIFDSPIVTPFSRSGNVAAAQGWFGDYLIDLFLAIHGSFTYTAFALNVYGESIYSQGGCSW